MPICGVKMDKKDKKDVNEKVEEVEWISMKPGEPFIRAVEENGQPRIQVITPQWVQYPPELGGKKVRILAITKLSCPCGIHGPVRTYILDDPLEMFLAECPTNGFMWYSLVPPEHDA